MKKLVGNATLYNADCLDILPALDPVDMVLSDPPYGTTACKWDTVIDLDKMWAGLKQCTKTNAAIVMTASQPFTSALVMSNPNMFRHEWIWKKNCGSNFAALKHNPFKEHESVLVFASRPTRFNAIREKRSPAGMEMVKSCKYEGYAGGGAMGGKLKTDKARRDPETRHPSSVQRFSVQRGLHPTQKPVALMEYLIKTYTNEGETVLDFTMGSGTTGVACANTGREFIGIELDANYFDIACRRIGESQKQGDLLGAA